MTDRAEERASDTAARAVMALEKEIWDALGLLDAIAGAALEARRSGLPGLRGGPADAYRHLSITGEMKRCSHLWGPPHSPALTTERRPLQPSPWS